MKGIQKERLTPRPGASEIYIAATVTLDNTINTLVYLNEIQIDLLSYIFSSSFGCFVFFIFKISHASDMPEHAPKVVRITIKK